MNTNCLCRKTRTLFLFVFLLVFCKNVVFADCSVVKQNKTKYNHIIEKYAKRYSIHPDFIKAVVWRESRFKMYAVGKAGEIGLMQVTIAAAKDWAKANDAKSPSRRELFNPDTNIKVGAWYLTRARNYWKSYKQCHVLALCEYNAGRKGMKRYLMIDNKGVITISSKHLHNYVTTIFKQYSQYVMLRSSSKAIVATQKKKSSLN